MLVDKESLRRISAEVEKENFLFGNKVYLDNLTLPSQIIGGERKAKKLVRFLIGYKKGLAVPFVSVYGRSGSGKSTVVRYVCENLDDDISYTFVNLRKARTVFGCANLILGELGQPLLKSPQGINTAIEKIGNVIEQRLSMQENSNKNFDGNKSKTNNDNATDNTKFFILVLDEFDVLLYDKRGKPSDFIYKLLMMEEKLREKGYMMCIIAISNNVMSEYEIDDRVRSRIGTSEVFFEPYAPQDIIAILKDRAEKAFAVPIDEEILHYCAAKSSQEHGDARRAIDLLRVAAEIAGKAGKRISKKHVDSAVSRLQKDRISLILSSASYHLKVTALALARITYLTEESWHYTSTLYNQYGRLLPENVSPLTYRRFSELMTELANIGLVTSNTRSKGRHGYGTQYKLVVPPELVGKVASIAGWWDEMVVRKKIEHDSSERFRNLPSSKNFPTLFGGNSNNILGNQINQKRDEYWKDFVGQD
jgi:archaeal cell division control protein 6